MVSESHPSKLHSSRVPDWLRTLASGNGRFSATLRHSDGDLLDGYRHTIREISQQPATWSDTAHQLVRFRPDFLSALDGCKRIVFTGSGSSQYVGECVAPVLQRKLQIPVAVLGGGSFLLGSTASVSGEPTLVVSLARSGDSPESSAVVHQLLATEPRTKHLILTCNAGGRLAREFAAQPGVRVVALSDEVHDRSLVMTSSFTNLVLSAMFLGWLDEPENFTDLAGNLDFAGRRLLTAWPDRLSSFVSGEVTRIIFLGDGARFGAAREASLKILEMTAGRVATMAETYLGFRHGPMCFADERALVVCFLSSDPLVRAYQRDLISELNAKGLGARKLIVGINDPGAVLCREGDLAIPYEFPRSFTDDSALALLDVVIGQILGFHRCRQEGLQPDSPSQSGVISRVVNKFRIYEPEQITQ